MTDHSDQIYAFIASSIKGTRLDHMTDGVYLYDRDKIDLAPCLSLPNATHVAHLCDDKNTVLASIEVEADAYLPSSKWLLCYHCDHALLKRVA